MPWGPSSFTVRAVSEVRFKLFGGIRDPKVLSQTLVGSLVSRKSVLVVSSLEYLFLLGIRNDKTQAELLTKKKRIRPPCTMHGS